MDSHTLSCMPARRCGWARRWEWPLEVSPEAVLIAAMFSIEVGVFFGYYPARKAAMLDPIEALRFE